ncbi:hypothetical protein PFICI_05104 [Pestalotiopsis fici W106-1]|uniref:Protein kinase domain-containing protein n=1 Tax=Pestalotiopsis fici (strain W106-1 / CGMCC3.15140) TaxID=1229662 RepID=W3XAY6_PESFW|nr:uncharacterized protein PFICI_05104 [Pestalotiopsis fici W106-1]ETS83228.1 hypothetical protein PFICI_05104 [Pestalotiopsis fici W106-1]
MKSTLDEVIRDMEDWQRRFDPSWYLILRIPDPMIDRALNQHVRKIMTAATARTSIEDMESHVSGTSIRSTNVASQSLSRQSPLINADGVRDALRPNPRYISIFLPEEDLDIVSIPYANAMLARRRGSTGTKWLIINSIQCTPSSNITAMTKDIRGLARKLTQVDPSRFGLLQCKGVIRLLRPPSSRLGPPSTPEIQSFDVVFRSPDGSSAFRCLREDLPKPAKVSLSNRVRIAQQIAQSVNYVHALNFVHKNIRPESILIWDGTGSKFPSTFLVGFDNIRSADGATNLIGDTEWTTNIYRHPTRQGERLLESHKMQHDIYSLGVCLLEIGLWNPLIHYVQQDGAGLSLQKRCRRGTVLDDFVAGREETSSMLSGEPFKKYLVDLANAELPTLVGDRYTDIVVNCLTCLDQKNNGFGDESEMLDEDGILVGVRFIEAVLLRLNEIVV